MRRDSASRQHQTHHTRLDYSQVMYIDDKEMGLTHPAPGTMGIYNLTKYTILALAPEAM